MTLSEAFAFAVVLLVGMPSMFRIGFRGGKLRLSVLNATAGGMVASYLILQMLALVTTGPVPLPVFLLCDFVVLTIIFLKAGPFECLELDDLPPGTLLTKVRTMGRRCHSCWREISRADKIIVGLFAPAWAAYAIEMSAIEQYWILWSIGLLQLFLAGAEAFGAWRRGRVSGSSEAHPVDWFMRQRWAGGHGW